MVIIHCYYCQCFHAFRCVIIHNNTYIVIAFFYLKNICYCCNAFRCVTIH